MMLNRGDILMLNSSAGLVSSFIEHGIILLDRETAVVVATILAMLWLIKVFETRELEASHKRKQNRKY